MSVSASCLHGTAFSGLELENAQKVRVLPAVLQDASTAAVSCSRGPPCQPCGQGVSPAVVQAPAESPSLDNEQHGVCRGDCKEPARTKLLDPLLAAPQAQALQLGSCSSHLCSAHPPDLCM